MTRFTHARGLLLALTSFACMPAHAASPGDLDGSFGAGGVVLQDASTTLGAATATVIQPDGKPVVVTAGALQVLRYHRNGTLDFSYQFDGAGELMDVALQPDGKIVVAGYRYKSGGTTDRDFFIGRLKADGTPDTGATGFDIDGYVTLSTTVTTSSGKGDYLHAVAILSSGDIVAVGSTQSNTQTSGAANPVTVRVTSSGAPVAGHTSTTTGSGPGVRVTLAGSFDQCGWTASAVRWRDVTVDSNDKLFVAGGYAATNGKWTPVIARLDADGALDGADARKLLFFNVTECDVNTHMNSAGRAIALQAPDKVIVAGNGTDDPANDQLHVYRLSASNLAYDAPFSNTNHAGRVMVNIGYNDGRNYGVGKGVDIKVQKNGRVVLASNAGMGSTTTRVDGTLARLDPVDGATEETFGGDGIVVVPMGWKDDGAGGVDVAVRDGFHALDIGADGDIVAAGVQEVMIDGQSVERVALARIVGDRTANPDLSCGVNGIQYVSASSGSDYGRAVLPAASGGYLAVTDFNTIKVDRNGNLVPGYNHEGGGGYITSAAYDVNGMTVVAGYTLNGEFMVARHDENGRLDKSFGEPVPGSSQRTGRKMISFGGSSIAYGVLVQPHDNKIVVVGRSLQGGNTKFALARLKDNGDLDAGDGAQDPGFGTGGLVITPETGNSSQALDVALDSQKRLVVVGVGDPNSGYFAVARYLPTGALDTSFSGDGIFTLVQGYRDRAYAVHILPNDGILVAGQVGKGVASRFTLLRLSAGGEIAGNTDIPVPGYFDASIRQLGLATQADGKYVLASSFNYYRADGSGSTKGVFVRVNPDFTLDNTFDGDGLLLVEPPPGADGNGLGAVAIRTDGRVVGVGYHTSGWRSWRGAAVCIHP